MQNKGSVKDIQDIQPNTDNTPTIGDIGKAVLEAAARANAAPTAKPDKPAKARAKYNIKPAGRSVVLTADNMPKGAFVAYRTVVGTTIMGPANRTRIMLPDSGDITVEVGQTVETDHRSGSHANCGIWTVVAITDDRALAGTNVAINYIALNS